MACLHPIFVAGRFVPCGICANCRQKLRKQMADRIFLEHKFGGGEAFFITLTYAPEFLPEHIDDNTGEILPAFSKEDTRMFTDNFRYFLRSRGLGTFRYFLTCELGEELGRSHYHLITLHKDLKPYEVDIKIIRELAEQSWSRSGYLLGRVQVVRANANRVNYATQYALKEEGYLYQRYDKFDNRKPFRKFSLRPGLGAEPGALQNMGKYCAQRGNYRYNFSFNGRGGECKKAVPKYIATKLGQEYCNDRKSFNEKWLQDNQEIMAQDKAKNSFYDPLDGKWHNDYTIDAEITARRKALRELRKQNFANKK